LPDGTAEAIQPNAPQRARPAFERNLVIVHQPGWQALEDWRQIGAHIRRLDPTTGVIILPYDEPNTDLAAHAAKLPTLVFSPGPLGRFQPRRGKLYHGQLMSKFEELRHLAAAGVPVPRSQLLTAETRLDPVLWGELVVLKPSVDASMGNGVQLIRTERVRYTKPAEYPRGHSGRNGPMIVQQFIDTGPNVNNVRVLTLFGEPLYCQLTIARDRRTELNLDNATLEAAPIATQAFPRNRAFMYDADMIALARKAHFAIPQVPLKGVDMVRQVGTGKLYVLEVNPKSNTWHFSSNLMERITAKNGGPPPEEYKSQLDGLGTAAHVLTAVARREAE
jgi:hypothetical protein